jgi:spore coat polysaccharide biosynthesis predicted glycosyltransferase SpsG
MNILIRCDGSLEIGMGHVVRCLALADALKESIECEIYFAMCTSELGFNKVEPFYTVIKSKEQGLDNENWLENSINQTNADILILDMRDNFPVKTLKNIKERNKIIIVTIDDPEDKRLVSDFAFYPPIQQIDEMNWDSFEGKLYVGWEYVILRKEFSCAYPKPDNSIPNILISMGGADEVNITEFVIESLLFLDESFEVTIIIGPGYQYEDQLLLRLESADYKYKIHQNPENITYVMSQADLAVISFGVTAYEIAALNIPAVYFCLTPDHAESANCLVNIGAGVSLGYNKNLPKEHIINTLIFLLQDYKKTEFIFDNNCIDGYGASRIARIINENINETIDTNN